ncbi:aromatic ring-hydroxylating dioxygenase subunit alpha [Frankia sp. AgB32]|uniref:aromatic ring-hydroxylating oxygenase subunit alpha n=1 Tax=Frankia sp. AgB32 TaxID=631119 RepID=UPI00200F63B4|nr:aromatic ring-hydroxylating dioxygenase subunit alpha [Frankia sp. AgB32]MCK9896253.1 aromatic ring-hydroxylating dioxygenase subunit alpha [Frankia sp. AgB32]
MADAADSTSTLPPGCSFDPADWTILARHWYPVALSREVRDQPVTARLLDERLVLYRAGAQVVVARDLCPHRGLPLSMGAGDGQTLACAYHGLRFGAGGDCVAIPAHPTARIPARMTLTAYPAVERYGLVWTCLRPDADQPAAPIPPMPHWDDPAFQQVTCPGFDVAAFAGRQVEGFLDVAHFAFVHTASFADPDNAEVPDYTTTATEGGFTADYWSTVANYPHGSGLRAEPGFRWLRRFDAHLPFTATLIVHFPADGRLSIMNAASPVSARQTRMFAPIAKNFATDQPAQEIYDFNLRIFEEDRAIVEAQRPENLPLDPRIEVNIAADRSSVAYRRGLRAMGLSHFFTA